MQKYELTDEAKELNGKVLHRIRALIDLDYVKAGDVGGWIESESNLDQTGNAWVSSNACVKDNARVSGNAWVSGNACVKDNAWVSGNACVKDNAWVSGNARVEDNAWVSGNVWLSGDARVNRNACVSGDARVSGIACVSGNARVSGIACVSGNAWVSRDAKVSKPCHVMTVGGIGAKNETLTFYRAEGEKIVVCGTCFLCTVDELEDRVRVMYGNSKHARAYALARELAKVQIEDVIIDA